jgi:predicted P-loop ATPase
VIPLNPNMIPAAMQQLPNWVYWKSDADETGKATKVPYVVGKANQRASSTDSGTWVTFAAARDGMIGSNGSFSFDGFGFALENSGVVFVDFDNVRNPETGEIASWARQLVAAIGSYTEVSPSGAGLHVYALGKLPGKGINRKFENGSALEMYDSGRYTTVTGAPLPGLPNDLRTSDVRQLYERLKNGQLGPDQGKTLLSEKKENAVPTAGTVRALLEKWGLTITANEDPYQGETETGIKFVLRECPFNPDHKDPAIFDYPSGPVFFCYHTSCAGRNWRELCNKFNVQPFIVGENGKPKAVLANAVLMLRQAPELQGVLGFNEFSLYSVTRRPAPWPLSAPGKNWTDDDDARAACWLQEHGILVSSKVAAEAVQSVARENPFHPVREYLTGLTWDGTPRLLDWLSTYLGAESSPLTSAIGQRWLISGVARIMRPGCKADHVRLLEGPQGIGESTALQTLASPEWFTDHLSDLGSKDSRIELHGKWIIELGEFVSRRSELERKAFLTACADNFRAPYERRAQWVPRSCVFAATTNDAVPLTDPSGARRYWPVTCGRVDLDRLREDRDQLWAEAYALYLAGEPWWDDFAEFRTALAEEQEARYQGGPHDESILAWCRNPQQRETWDNGTKVPVEPFDSNRQRVTIADILLHSLGKPVGAATRSDQLSVRDCLIHAGWRREKKQTKIRGTNRVVRFYIPREVPLPWQE